MFFSNGQNAAAANRAHDLDKALTIGDGPPPGTRPGTGAPYAQENLDGLLVNVTRDETDMRLWPNLFKQVSPGPLFQYNLVTAWGRKRPTSRFQGEIARPRADSATVVRMKETVAYMGILGQVSFAAMNTRMLVDPEVQELRTQTAALLQDIETLCYTGDASLNPQGFDGYRTRILKQSPRSNIIDCHGRGLTLDQVDQMLTVIRKGPNYGRPTDIHLDYGAHAAFNRTFVPQFRDTISTPGPRQFNLEFDRFRSVVGDVKLSPTVFIDAGSNGLVDAQADPNLVPRSPTVDTVQVGSPSGATESRFFDSDAGAYYWFVQAENQDGVSPMVQVNTSAVGVSAGQVASFNITAAQGARTDFFTVFRTKMNVAPVIANGQIIKHNSFEIARVPNVVTTQGAAPVPFLDTNFKLPGTTEGYVFDFRPETMFWVQMLALGKTDLGIFQSAKEFMLEIYGCPALRVPGRVGLFTNIESTG